MIKQILFVAFIFSSILLNAQTGIGTTSPDPSAKLEVSATNKGFLPPRITLTSVTDATTIPNPATGLLVYNTGTNVNLAAGYYYWNGASWSTIATATIAGSGVVASDMVKLYAEGYSNASGKIAHANGKVFSVPVSGRYLFDFSCSRFNNATITFKVRQGTTDLGSDFQTSFNNNVHVEYNGKIEVNLLANTDYNVFVSSTGNRDSGDYDRVYMKQVAGNLPVNVYPWVLSGNDVYNTSGNVGIGNNAPTSKLDVTGDLKVSGASTTNYLTIGTGTGDEGGEFSLARAQTNQSLGGNVNVDVYRNNLRIFEGGGSNRGVSIDLSKAPNAVGGELAWKKSGFVDAGTFVSLDNVKASVSTTGTRGLSIGAVSTTFEADVSGWYTVAGGNGGSTANNITYTTTAAGSFGNWNFPTHGDMVQVNLRDKTNNRFYRITMMIGSGYISNFICIERLF